MSENPPVRQSSPDELVFPDIPDQEHLSTLKDDHNREKSKNEGYLLAISRRIAGV